MSEAPDWPRLSQLGSGGQSTVYLVRNPTRTSELDVAMAHIRSGLSGIGVNAPDKFIDSLRVQLRPDQPSDYGALKLFDKVREGGTDPVDRIGREINILQGGYANLPKLLASNASEKWMITEYFAGGTLEKHTERYKGNALLALIAFQSLVETVAHLHRSGIVHRDIKPANIFVADSGKLVPGDFGIAHWESGATRLTVTNERVGPWDYMPQWADTGERLDEVKPSFDVYMLGKLLWCMASGRLRLPREYHRRTEYDLSRLFPDDRYMNSINWLLDECLVEHEDKCLPSAVELAQRLRNVLAETETRFVHDSKDHLTLPCLVCGKGIYQEFTKGGRGYLSRESDSRMPEHPINLRVFVCEVCTHYTFFAPNYPEEAANRGWRKLG